VNWQIPRNVDDAFRTKSADECHFCDKPAVSG
jgi:hypothetical protein